MDEKGQPMFMNMPRAGLTELPHPCTIKKGLHEAGARSRSSPNNGFVFRRDGAKAIHVCSIRHMTLLKKGRMPLFF